VANIAGTGWLANLSAKRRSVISYVKSPLGFYVLALLIIETFLIAAGTLFNLSETMRIISMGLGVLLFVLVVGVVTLLAIRYPQSLVFSEHSHIEWESLQLFGDSSKPLAGTIVRARPSVEPLIKPEQPNTLPISDLKDRKNG